MDKLSYQTTSTEQKKIQKASSITSEIDLNDDQKKLLYKIIQDIQSKNKLDLSTPEVQKLLIQEFQLLGQEIKGLEQQILSYFTKVVTDHQNIWTGRETPVSQYNVDSNYSSNKHYTNITEQQKKEFDEFQTLDYGQYPVQPCVRSLYYISKIAQQQQINISVPPTILIMANEDNRFMHTCPTSGNLVIQNQKINEQSALQFIKKQMLPILQSYSLESQLLVPKFVIRIAQNSSRKNDCKVYFNLDIMIADSLVYWGNCDMAIQIYVKQKVIRPKFYRYYIKRGLVYKSVQISNNVNLNRDHNIYRTMQQLIEQYQGIKTVTKQIKGQQNNGSDKLILNLKNLRISNNTSKLSNSHSQSLKLPNPNKNQNEHSHFEESDDPLHLTLSFKDNSASRPQKQTSSLQNMKLSGYDNDLQVMIPPKKLKKAYCCTSDNLKNLKISQFRPSALPQAERMTLDLYRLFNSYYLKTNKFGNISSFICDFIEGENGIIYLLQVKSFQCEGVIYDWQQVWQPTLTKTIESPLNSQKNIFNDLQLQVELCEAKIICQLPNFNKYFVDALVMLDMYKLNTKKTHQLPKVSQKQVQKYKSELEFQRNEWKEIKEKLNVCPLIPLISFKEVQREKNINSPGQRRRGTRALSNSYLQNINNYSRYDDENTSTSIPASIFNLYQIKQNINQRQTDNSQISNQVIDKELNSCVCCFKIIELYKERHQTLTFKSDEVVKELKYLKFCLMNQWSQENILFVLKQYQQSKISTFRVPLLDKLRKQKLRQRQIVRSVSTKSLTGQTSPKNTQVLTLPVLEDRDQQFQNESKQQDQNIEKLLNPQEKQQIFVKQQESIAKLHSVNLSRFKAQSENTRNTKINSQRNETLNNERTLSQLNQLENERKSSNQILPQRSINFLRKLSIEKDINLTRNELKNLKEGKNISKQISDKNPRTVRQQISTIEEIYKEIPPQTQFAIKEQLSSKNSVQKNMNIKELSKVISHFGLKLTDMPLPLTHRENNEIAKKGSNLASDNISSSTTTQKQQNQQLQGSLKPLKNQKQSFYRQFIAASNSHRNALDLNSIQNTNNNTTSPNSLTFINLQIMSNNSQSQLKSQLNIQKNNNSIINASFGVNQSIEQQLLQKRKQSQQSLLTPIDRQNGLQGNQTQRDNFAGGDISQREADLSMYFNNKRKIQNSKVQLSYRQNIVNMPNQNSQRNLLQDNNINQNQEVGFNNQEQLL